MLRGLLLALALGIGWTPGMVQADEVVTWFEAHSSELVKLYEHFHAHPELSFHEKETAAKLAEELKSAPESLLTLDKNGAVVSQRSLIAAGPNGPHDPPGGAAGRLSPPPRIPPQSFLKN